MEPRIYTYKITFPEQGWWYWGVHKERVYDELYYGSPVTHAEKWENFEYEKQILEFFEDWDEAKRVEKRLIFPDLHNPLCLNENEGGNLSLQACSKGGKIMGPIRGRKNVESGHLASICSKGGKAAGKIAVESGQLKSVSSKGGKIGGKLGGRKAVESGHLASVSSIGGKAGSKKTNAQKWMCLVTDHVTTSGALTNFQKARGIDPKQRIRVN